MLYTCPGSHWVTSYVFYLLADQRILLKSSKKFPIDNKWLHLVLIVYLECYNVHDVQYDFDGIKS